MTNKKQFFSYECLNKMIKSRKKENPKVLWKRQSSLNLESFNWNLIDKGRF